MTSICSTSLQFNSRDGELIGALIPAALPTRPKPSTISPRTAQQISDLDPRLAFLERADALLILIEAAELSVDEAFDRLMPAIYEFADCRCYREILEKFDGAARDRRNDHRRDRGHDDHDHEDAAYHGRPACGDAWLRGLVRAVANAAVGQRNSTLFWASCRVGEAIRDGKAADEGFVVDVLTGAAMHAGLPEREARQTIKSGMRRYD